MKHIGWSRFFYLIGILLLVAGAALKILKQDHWQFLWIGAAACLLVNFVIGQVQDRDNT